MKQSLLPHPILTPILALIWLLLVNSFSVGHLLLGLFLGWAIPVFTLRFWPESVAIRRPLTLLRFIGLVFYDILVANVKVAALILGRATHLQPAFVTVPLALRTDLAMSLLASTVSLTPGTISAWLNPERTHLVVHGLTVTDPDALIAEIKQRYEAPLKEVFEPC